MRNKCGIPWVIRSLKPFNWYRDMRFILEKNGISWANWDYKGRFEIVDGDESKSDDDLIHILVGKPEMS